MLPLASQQSPCAHALLWQSSTSPCSFEQQPFRGTAVAHSLTLDVASCARWHPYAHERLWKPSFVLLGSVVSGKERLATHAVTLLCGGGGLGGGGLGGGLGGAGPSTS